MVTLFCLRAFLFSGVLFPHTYNPCSKNYIALTTLIPVNVGCSIM